MFLCCSVYLFIYLFGCASVCLSIYLCLSFVFSINLSIYLYTCLSVCLFIYIFINLLIYLSLPIHLSVYLSFFIHAFNFPFLSFPHISPLFSFASLPLSFSHASSNHNAHFSFNHHPPKIIKNYKNE